MERIDPMYQQYHEMLRSPGMGGLRSLLKRVSAPLGWRLAAMPSWQIVALASALIGLISVADYLTGVEITLALAYLAPIALACWYAGGTAGLVMAGLCVLMRAVIEDVSGVVMSSLWVPVENGAVRLLFYSSLALGLSHLKHLHSNLELLANQRAVALAQEIAERQKLERAMLDISEREQRRIGQDLHDSLCQHLTGIALVSQALAERLEGRGDAEAARALKVVDLVEDGISMARGMAKGLHPVEMQADGLMQALEEFAANTTEIFGVTCRFDCQVPVLIHVPATATHLYRIAQEAASNAIKHGQASEIVILLEETEQGVHLAVSDNGKGLPDPLPSNAGMGLRIMADRAKVIGGALARFPGRTCGTRIDCRIPQMALDELHG